MAIGFTDRFDERVAECCARGGWLEEKYCRCFLRERTEFAPNFEESQVMSPGSEGSTEI